MRYPSSQFGDLAQRRALSKSSLDGQALASQSGGRGFDTITVGLLLMHDLVWLQLQD
jgi:hypothetical protein